MTWRENVRTTIAIKIEIIYSVLWSILVKLTITCTVVSLRTRCIANVETCIMSSFGIIISFTVCFIL